MSKLRFVGLDVHADTIAVAIAEAGGEVRSLGIIPNRLESIRKMVGKLAPIGTLKCCYEAGPTGYVLYWQLTQLGVACEVIAPSLIPTKAGDRVKTDRRGRREAGTLLSGRRANASVGSGCRARGAARSGTGAGSGQERPASPPPQVREISAAARQTS